MPEKITAMVESTSLADSDLITVVDDTTGTPDNVKVSLATLKAFVNSTGGGGGGSTGIDVIGTVDISTGSTGQLNADFSVSTGYRKLVVEGWALPATDASHLELFVDDGGGIDNSTEYGRTWWVQADGAVADGGGDGVDSIWICRDNFQLVGNSVNEAIEFTVNITRHEAAAWTQFKVTSSYSASNDANTYFLCAGTHQVEASLDTVRLTFDSGNIAGAGITMIGYR